MPRGKKNVKSNQRAVAEAIGRPRTIKEISEITGLTHKQVRVAMVHLHHKGVPYKSMGSEDWVHYYLSPRVLCGYHKIVSPPVYQQLLDLINTDEWWTKEECTSILEISDNNFSTGINQLRKKGWVIDIKHEGRCKYSYFVKGRADELSE